MFMDDEARLSALFAYKYLFKQGLNVRSSGRTIAQPGPTSSVSA